MDPMTWKNDGHGLVFKSNELKLYRRTHSWGMKLSQLPKQRGTVRIVTFRLPGSTTYDDYYETQIARRPSDMLVLIGSGGRRPETPGDGRGRPYSGMETRQPSKGWI